MSVNRISQSHANEIEAVQNVNSQKSQLATTKANAVDGPSNSHGQVPQARQPQQPAKSDNNAGQEQARQQNTANDTNGSRVNVFA